RCHRRGARLWDDGLWHSAGIARDRVAGGIRQQRASVMKGSLVAGVALMLSISGACAADYKVGDLQIGHPWSRATPKGSKIASGYLSITNTGSAEDRLVSGTFAQSGGFQIHEMSMDGGVMRMRQLKALDIKPGETVELKPSSNHLMFTDLTKPLA